MQWAQTESKSPFLLIAMWGSFRSITLGLGCIHLTHIFPGIFAFHKVGATRESSSIRKGIFAEKSAGFQNRFAGKYDGLVHPHSRFSPRRMVPNGTCIKMLACFLASSHSSSPPSLDEMAGRLAHTCCAMARPSEQQCLYSHNVCALFCVIF